MQTETRYPARLIIITDGAQHVAYFRSVEDATQTLNRFSAALCKVREYSNRDEEPVFCFRGAGASYAVDLRKSSGASVELTDEWADVGRELSIKVLDRRRQLKAAALAAGLTEELAEYDRASR